MRRVCSRAGLFGLAVAILCAKGIVLAHRVQAQVTGDGTFNTNVNSVSSTFTITNGTAKGSNLFHSFGQFSIPTGGVAAFDLINTPNVSTIFSRVTGGSPSNIDGTIRTVNHTNPVSLFLLNPSGILFGTNARLDIGGSFVGTTASGIRFADGVEFSAESAIAPLLTMSVPVGLQIGQNPGAIVVNGTGHTLQLPTSNAPIIRTSSQTAGLQVKPNQTLALVGGNVTLEGGVLLAAQGSVAIVSGANGNVSLTPLAQGWQFNPDSLQAYRDIQLANRSLIEASGAGNTEIQLIGKTIQIRSGSIALMTTQGIQPPGSFQIKASEAFQLSGLDRAGRFGSFLISDAFAGTGAAVSISTPQLELSDTAAILSRAFGARQGGNITIEASTVQVDGQADRSPALLTRIATVTRGQSDSGTLTIAADRLRVLNGGLISTSNFGSGRGGKIAVIANTVNVEGISPISQSGSLLTAAALGRGNAGNLSLNTQELSVTGGGNVSTSTLAYGNAGNLEINATRSIKISGRLLSANSSIEESNISSEATIAGPLVQQLLGLPPIPSGDAGNITINTPLLSILDGGTVTVDNEGTGNAGTLDVNANSIYLNGTSSIAAATAVGEGGNVSLQAQTLLLRDRSSITTTAGGLGNGGNITIQSPIILGLENSDVVANAVRGQGGNIQIATQGLFGLQYRDRLTPDNDISASSEFGINGIVQINHIDVDPNSGLVTLPTNVIDPTQKIAQGCKAIQGNSFVVSGRGGVPTDPAQEVHGTRIWIDVRDFAPSNRSPVALQPAPTFAPLIEATTWQRNLTTGKTELIAGQAISSGSISTCAAP